MPKIWVCAATRSESEGARLGVRRSGLEGWFEFLRTGMGPARAARSLIARLAATEPRNRPDKIISTGFAGSWSPALRVGEWIEALAICDESENPIEPVPESGLAQPALLCSVGTIHAAPMRALLEKIQGTSKIGLPVAVDMESFGLARIARESGIAFSVIRYVTDSADRPLPDFIRHTTRALAPEAEDHVPDRMRAAANGALSLLRQPSDVAALLRDGFRWRRELIEGWARFAERLTEFYSKPS